MLGVALGAGCARWSPATPHDVPTQVDSDASYRTALEVAKAQEYTVVAQDPATKRIRLEAKHTSSDAAKKSFIDVEVLAGSVRLTGAGYLAHGGEVHRALSRELSSLEEALKARLSGGTPLAAASGAPALAPAASAAPAAWLEQASDTRTYGNASLTCVPAKIPPEHQAALSLQLSTGEKADLQLSILYAPELCRSCKVSGGCPALGIGDPDQAGRLAQRLQKGEVAPKATLFDGTTPVATIDLSRHGSIAQAGK
jgi:hypothetical protein